MTKLEELSNWYVEKELDFDRILQGLRYRTIKKYFQGESCLEIAPAQGITTALLKDDFKTLHIVDGSQNLLNLIPDYSNVTKFHSMIEDFQAPMKYDFVLMDHILEHVEHPVIALKKVADMMKDDAVFAIGVPNARSIHRLAAVKMGYLDSIYQLNERDHELGHYRVYDFDSLEKDILSAGFKVKDRIGVFFKPLSNKQIQESWTSEMIEGFYQLGFSFPDNAAEIYITATK
ncbi:MAG: class I SAM-dependent methyltransferase [Chitinophagaceae bacterium]